MVHALLTHECSTELWSLFNQHLLHTHSCLPGLLSLHTALPFAVLLWLLPLPSSWHQTLTLSILFTSLWACRQALIDARPSCPGRKEFARADLVTWGLLAEMGTDTSLQVSPALLLLELLACVCVQLFACT